MSDKERNDSRLYYSDLTDEELLNLYKNGDPLCFDAIMLRYKNMVLEIAKDFFLVSGDKDDLIQEGMIGLYKAVRDYKEDSAAKFSTFAYTCIKRQILTAVTKDNNKKNMPLNMSLPTEKDKDDNDISDEGLLSDNGVSNPEFLILKKEDNLEKRNKLMTVLSPFEQSVCEMMFMEYDYRADCRKTQQRREGNRQCNAANKAKSEEDFQGLTVVDIYILIT